MAWGIGLQILLAVLVLKTGPGQAVMAFANRVVTTLVEMANVGAEFVFGESYADHWVAFAVPSTIIFFSALMGVLYHLGVLQWVVRVMAVVIVRVLPVSGADIAVLDLSEMDRDIQFHCRIAGF